MNIQRVSTVTGTNTTTTKTYKIEMIEEVALNEELDDMDDDEDPPSSPGSLYDDQDAMHTQELNDEVVQQLAAAGPVGVAAAAAIASSKKRRRPHSFETNPSIRKRQQNRLLRKLRQIIYEFTGRVGQQAIVLVATPGKPNTSYKVFGAKPLEDVVRNLRSVVMEELETALANQAPPPQQEDPSLFELPPLIIDGIPTPVEKMTQAQLRAFIPLMLKYSTGRGKPGWGRESTRPPWWPKELPWANVRMDARTEEDKQKISWTHALRKIVINCYKYHGREDLLPTFSDEDEKTSILITNALEQPMSPSSSHSQTMTIVHSTMSQPSSQTSVVTTTAAANAAAQHANNNVSFHNVGTVLKLHNSGTIITQSNINHQPQNIIQTSNGTTKIELQSNNGNNQSMHHQNHHNQMQTSNSSAAQTIANAQVCLDPMTLSDVEYTQAVISTIQNADGTVSLFQVDPNNPIITLPDGTTAQVQGVATLHQGEGGATIQTVQSLTDANGHENMTVDLTEATLGQDGQLIITGEDGQGYPVSMGNMITLPVSASVYANMMANIQQIHPNGDGTVCITPMQVDSNNYSNNSNSNNSTNNSNSGSSLTYIHSSNGSNSIAATIPPQTTVYQNGKLVRAIFTGNIATSRSGGNRQSNQALNQNSTNSNNNSNNNNNSSSQTNEVQISSPSNNQIIGNTININNNIQITHANSASVPPAKQVASKRRKQNLSHLNDKSEDSSKLCPTENTKDLIKNEKPEVDEYSPLSPIKLIKIEKIEKQ